MSLISQFEQQYAVQSAEVMARIGQLKQSTDTDDVKRLSTEIDQAMRDVEDLLDQMELSVRELPSASSERTKYNGRVVSYKRDKQNLVAEYEKVKTQLQRQELMLDGGDDLDTDQRNMLVGNTERLERSSRKLEDGYRIALEAEEAGASTLANLAEQRSTLQRARNRMADTEGDLGQSGKVLNVMIARIIQNRVAMFAIIGFLVFVFIVIIWSKL